MNRVAGMTINDNGAALAILRRSHGKWGTERAETFNLDALLRGPWMPGCIVIFDAAAWDRQRRDYDSTRPGEAGWTLPSIADRFLAAGWDVRPPRWEGGRAANPSTAEFADNLARTIDLDALLHRLQPLGKPCQDALLLAAWGATMPTTAALPQRMDPDGPCIGPPCAVTGPHRLEACRVNMPALRSEDDPHPASR